MLNETERTICLSFATTATTKTTTTTTHPHSHYNHHYHSKFSSTSSITTFLHSITSSSSSSSCRWNYSFFRLIMSSFVLLLTTTTSTTRAFPRNQYHHLHSFKAKTTTTLTTKKNYHHGSTSLLPSTTSILFYNNNNNQYASRMDISSNKRTTTATNNPSFCTLLKSYNNDNDNDDSIQNNDNNYLDFLQDQICQLNGGIPINLQSPKQISMAIFGTIQSTSKLALEQAVKSTKASSSSLSPEKRQLAFCILQAKEYLLQQKATKQQQRGKPTKQQQQQQQRRSFSSTPSTSGTSSSSNTRSTPRQQQQQQQQQNMSTMAVTSSSPSSTLTWNQQQQQRDDDDDFLVQEEDYVPSLSSSFTVPRRTMKQEQQSSSSPPPKQESFNNKKYNKYNKKVVLAKTHEQMVHQLFENPTTNCIDPYWKEPLLKVIRPNARALIAQLDGNYDTTNCPMGYNPDYSLSSSSSSQATTTKTATTTAAKIKKSPKQRQQRGGTFLSYCQTQKELHPQCIILVRCGDFYETYGIDAIMLVEHVGLNPMGGKAKAGCPYRNIQATIDGLTRVGFSVAVYEEVGAASTNTNLKTAIGNNQNHRGKKTSTSSNNSKLKTRVLAQIVSPASPTYLYDSSWLLGGGNNNNNNGNDSGDEQQQQQQQYILDGLPPSRPCVGIAQTSAGYNLVEISMEERSVTYSERLTPEALACRLTAYPPADPVVYIPGAGNANTAAGTTTIGSNGSNKHSSTAGVTASSLPFLGNIRASNINNNNKANGGGIYGNMLESSFGGYRLRTKIIPPHLIPTPRPGISDADRYIETIVNTFLQLNQEQQQQPIVPPNGNDDRNTGQVVVDGPTVDDFTISMKSTKSYTNPLYVETATQLGLLQDPHIPSLTKHILEDAAPAVTRRFLHRYLLVPPPPEVAQAMATVVKALLGNDNDTDNENDDYNENKDSQQQYYFALPPLTVPPLGKVLSLIRAGQASATIYGELLQSLSTTSYVLSQEQEQDQQNHHEQFINALLILCEHESGLPATRESLLQRCHDAMYTIESVISPTYHVLGTMMEEHEDDGYNNYVDAVTTDEYIPAAYLERNEAPWRGRIRPEVVETSYQGVAKAAKRLSKAVKEDFICQVESNQALIVQDIFNNIFALKQIPTGARSSSSSSPSVEYFHPRDRHGKLLKNRYTTTKVQDALGDYISACDAAKEEVSEALSKLAEILQDNGHIPAIAQSAHLNLVLSAAFHHAVKANQKNWKMANVIETWKEGKDNEENSAHFVNLWPYWMEESQAVPNTFDLDGMFLLTAPNMSGKSTLMRSTAAAALLTCCGLCAPLKEGSTIPRFDTLFLRGASADVPAENKSAFGAEMGDIAALMRCCGSNSLVFVDELGRGTSPNDGTRLAGAVLEAMAKRGMKGIFATHLHDILDLPLERKDRIKTKRMAIKTRTRRSDYNNNNNDINDDDDENDDYDWTYQLEDGICNDSLALLTAARFGLPEEIIHRAEEFTKFLPQKVLPTGGIENESDYDDNDNDYYYDDNSSSLDDSSTMEQISTNTFSSLDEETYSSSEVPPQQQQQVRQNRSNNFQKAVALVEQLIGETSSSSSSTTTATITTPIVVPPRWSPPASCERKSCLYVLELAVSPPRYYVGETDSISQRLRQHRRKGSAWAKAKAVVFPVSSKTQARAWESLCIQKLAQSGFLLESTTDGRKLRRF